MTKICTFSVELIEILLNIFCRQKITQDLLALDRGRGLRREINGTIKVRGKPKCATLTPTLSRRRERGNIISLFEPACL